MARSRSREAPSDPGRRALLGRLGIAAASGVGALGLAEWLARRVAPAQAPVRLEQFTTIVEGRHGFRFEDVFVADDELFWRLAPSVRLPDDARPLFGLVSNRAGLREDHEIARGKAPGELRILALGDSCTFGYLLPHEATWVERLERGLRGVFAGLPIECINAGVPGWTLFQGWRFLETRARALAPDLVVLNFGWNETVAWDGRSDFEHHEAIAARRPPGPLASSHLARLAWNALGRDEAEAAPARRPRLLPTEFRDLLERCRTSALGLGAETLVLVGGARSNLEQERFGDYLSPLQVEQLDFGRRHPFGPRGASSAVDGVALIRALHRDRPLGAILLDGVHPTPETNEALAAALAERLAPWIAERRTASRAAR